jgi:copper chaperone CopZ
MGKKITIGIILLIIILGFFIVAKNTKSNVSSNVITEQPSNLHEVSLSIEDMYCDACAYGVQAQLEELDGVISADINALEGTGLVLYNADIVDSQTIAAASTVYPATVVSDNPKE